MIGENQLTNMVGKKMNPKLKIFLSFLKREGCYETFKDNYLNTEKHMPACHSNLSFPMFFEREIEYIIGASFFWHGRDKIDWADINNKYLSMGTKLGWF